MLQIILIVVGIFYFIRRPKVARLKAEDMPGVQPETLERWKSLELKSIDWFLYASWGVSIVGTILGLMIGLSLPSSGVIVFVTILGFFLAGLTVSAVYGSQSAKLKKQMMLQAGFKLP